MADNNDKDLEPEVNLGEANIEGKNAAYFANLSSNVKKASQQNENAAASANYKTPKNFGKSAVLNAEQRKTLRNKLTKLTPSKYKIGANNSASALAVPKFRTSKSNRPKNINRPNNSTGLLTNAEKFNFTRKKPKTNAVKNNAKVNSPELEAERELQKKITPIAEKVQLLEKLKEVKYKLQDGITGNPVDGKASDMTLKEYTVTINDINKKLKEFGYIDVKVKDVRDFKQYVPFIFDTELEGLKSELLVKQKELKEAHKRSLALNRKSNTRKKFSGNAEKLRVKSLAAYHAANKKKTNVIEEAKKTGVKVNPFEFEYIPRLQKIETELNENALEEEASAKRIAAAKEKAKLLVSQEKAKITLANEKARAEGKPFIAEPAPKPKTVVENNNNNDEPALPAAPAAPAALPAAAPAAPAAPAAVEVNTKLLGELAEVKAAKEATDAQLAEVKAAKEAADAQLAEVKAAKEAIGTELAEVKEAKEAAEAKLAEVKAANKGKNATPPSSPTVNDPQLLSEEVEIRTLFENGTDGFPPLKLPETLNTHFEHAIKPYYDKAVNPYYEGGEERNRNGYVELYIKLYVYCYILKKEKISAGDLFEVGEDEDLLKYLTPELQKELNAKLENNKFYKLMFEQGISQLYHPLLKDTPHIAANLANITLE